MPMPESPEPMPHDALIIGGSYAGLSAAMQLVRARRRVLVIDGGFSKAYQSVTGIAGYTLIYNSYGMRLVAHEPFESREAAIEHGLDIHSETVVVQRVMDRRSVGDTDNGVVLKQKIEDLKQTVVFHMVPV